MRLWTVSDLHMGGTYWVPNGRFPKHDVMIIAGDVDDTATDTEWRLLEVCRWSDAPIVFVPGNHDHHRSDLGHWETPSPDLVDLGVHVLAAGQAVVIDGVRFIGATLWTDFLLFDTEFASQAFAAKTMTEYRHVWKTDGTDHVWPIDTAAAHTRHRAAIEAELAVRHPGPTVVVTHHAPSARSVAGPIGVEDAAYASDLTELIVKHQPDLWVHGHIHQAVDYRIDRTRVVCNPRGYTRRDWEEETGWDETLVIEI